MAEIVDDTKDTASDVAKPALVYGGATFLGQNMAGNIGRGAGALIAGSYVGGTVGDSMAAIGGGEALAGLATQMFAGGGGGSSTGTREV